MQYEVLYWVCFGRFSLREKLYLIRRLIRRFAAPICLQIAPHGEGIVRYANSRVSRPAGVCANIAAYLLFVQFDNLNFII